MFGSYPDQALLIKWLIAGNVPGNFCTPGAHSDLKLIARRQEVGAKRLAEFQSL